MWARFWPVLLVAAGCGADTVAHQQIEREANRIVVLLRQSGIEASKMRDEESRDLLFGVVVSKNESTEALRILEKHNLPELPKADTAKLFEKEGMIPTNEQQRAKREVGVTGDIQNQLRMVPRVVNVMTTVSIPDDDPLRDPTIEAPRPKASVILVYMPDETNKSPLTGEDVQRFVQARLPELKAQEVHVQMIADSTGGLGGVSEEGEAFSPTVDPAVGCLAKEEVLGIEVCAGKGHKKNLLTYMIAIIVVAILFAGMAIWAVLKAYGYRKDLTRLTAQFEQLRAPGR